MNRIFFTIALVLIAQSLPGQTIQEGQSLKAESALVFKKTFHDFGILCLNDRTTCEFKFYNKGEKPIIISEIKTACGCTVPSWEKTPVMSGDSSAINVNFHADETGVFNKTITVISNASKQPYKLELYGKVTER